MPSHQEWLVGEQIAYVKFWGVVTSEEVGYEVQRSADLRAASDADWVHYLHDWREVEQFPTDLKALNKIVQSRKRDRTNLGWVVAYGTTNRTLNMLGDMFFRLLQVRFRLFEKPNNAIAFLQNVDPTLPPFTSDVLEGVMVNSDNIEA